MSEAKRHDSTSLQSSWIDWRPFDAAPAERLALLRILVGLYTLAYLAAHAGMFSAMSRTDAADFRPIGVLRWMDRPIAPDLAQDVFAMTVASTVLFTIGWLHRPAALVHSILLLIIMTYRNSWSMIYHSQNLVVLHTVVLAIAPASQVWSLDAWRHSKSAESKRSQTKGESKDAAARLTRQRHSSSSSQPSSPKPPANLDNAWLYGWAIWLISALTVTTYWLAGVAKVMGPLGWNWALGVALRDQIAVDAIRKEVLSGQSASALAFALYPYSWIFTCMGVGTLVLEIGAPLFMMRRRWAMIWAVLALMMHWGIYLIMGITFRYQLCGLVVASFFPIERPVIAALRRWSPRSSAFHQSLRLSKAVPLVLVVCLVGATAGVLLWPFVVPRQTLTAHPLVAGSQSPTLPTKTDIDEAINHASDYLRTHRQDNGRWIYRTDLANSQVDRRSYNILRHAGAIYALSVAHQRSANDDNVPVIHAAVQFLNDQVRPVSNQYDVRAVWSDVDFRDPKHPYTAKLGGAGLGLLALMTAQEAVHVYIPDPIPQSLGNFLLSMQEPNGRMRSKWVDGADTGSQWESLYYPGEAALGLIRLSEFCQDMRYAQAAQRLLLYLARERKSLAQVPPDHWALIATRQLLQPISILHDRLSLTDDERRELLDHAAQISRSMLDEQKSVVGPPLIVGSFTSDGRTTPTATRLEGLLAMHPLFQAEANTRPLSREIAKAAERGIAFLLRAQVVQGPQRGGFPRAIGTWEPAESIEQQEANRLASEIRIDYVQHALCALIEYERLREYKR